MRYIGQLAIILVITFLGEIMNKLLPLPIPGSIYGFIIMLLGLQFKILKLEHFKEVGSFLLDTMSIMFVPGIVGLIVVWGDISHNIVQIMFICISTTIMVMVVTGKVTEFVIKKDGDKSEGSH